MSIPFTSVASIRSLQVLSREDGRIRYTASKGLYVSRKRSGNPVSRFFDRASGLTTTKREGVFREIAVICKRNGLNFFDAMKDAGLPPEELAKVLQGKGDLKATHLNAALSKFVQVGDKPYKIEKVLGKGAFGEVLLATNVDGEQLALKRQVIQTLRATKKLRSESDSGAAFRKEVKIHELVGHKKIWNKSYVVESDGTVEGADGATYQVMKMVGIGDGEKLIGQREDIAKFPGWRAPLKAPLSLAEVRDLHDKRPLIAQKFLDVSATSPLLIITVRDWLDGLRQTASAGIAHRDIKPGNYLLSPEGEWKITDYGTSGDQNDRFAPRPGVRSFALTGNSNDFAKSTEWLASEKQIDDGEGSAYQVASKDDVFAFGVAAYRLLVAGRFPFDGTAEDPDVVLGGVGYTEVEAAYAASGLSFSKWHEDHTGYTIPDEWKPLLDGALNSDPEMRLSADGLRKLKLFNLDKVTVQKARQELVRGFKTS